MSRIFFIFILSLSLSLFSCFKNQQEKKPAELYFEIDNSKLGDTITDDSLQITFRAPKYWNPLEKKQADIFWAKMDSVNRLSSDVLIKPKHIFVDSAANCFLMVSSVALGTTSSDSVEIANIYNSLLSNQFKDFILKKGEFYKENILMTQYVIKDEAKTVLKLFFNTKPQKLVQFDYFILSNYENEIKTIESSIGSITKQTKGGI